MKYAVALEGGGTKGAYHAGVLKALKELGVEIEAITGTSIGAINAAYFIQEGPEALVNFWERIQPSQLIPDLYPTIIESLEKGSIIDAKNFFKEVKETLLDKGLDLSSFKQTLYEYIDEKKIRASLINFGLVTYSLTDMTDVQPMISEIPEGKLIEYLIASSYLPGFKRERIDGKVFLDGAFYDNLPVSLLVQNGYQNIIAVELPGIGLKKRVHDDNIKIITIKPSDDTGHIVDFKPGLNLKNIQMGYCDTLKIFNVLYGQWFYIKDIWSPEMAYGFLDSLSKGQVDGLAELLNIKEMPYKRRLFEKIIPKVMKLIHIPEDADYNMVLLYILEYLGKVLELDRYHILTFDALVERIIQHLDDYMDESVNWHSSIVQLLKTTKLYSHTFKDKLLIGCAQIVITGNKQGGKNGL